MCKNWSSIGICGLLTLCVAFAFEFHTTVSPLRAFKQLGFDGVLNQKIQLPPNSGKSYNSRFSLSSYNQLQSKDRDSNALSHHPNEILSNMGVNIPSNKILG